MDSIVEDLVSKSCLVISGFNVLIGRDDNVKVLVAFCGMTVVVSIAAVSLTTSFVMTSDVEGTLKVVMVLVVSRTVSGCTVVA